MKLISWNINGIIARTNDGRLDKIFEFNPDIFCIQEVKANPKNLDSDIIHKKGYYDYFYPPQNPELNSFSGVAVYSRMAPISLNHGFNNKFDNEGRIQRLEFEEFNLYNVYFPAGTPYGTLDKKMALEKKFEFYDLFTEYVMKSNKPQVICGDFNRIREEKDAIDPQSLRNKSGFLPKEEQWFEEFIEMGFIDSFRLFNDECGNYTWWADTSSKEENNGLRFDYFLVNKELKDNIKNATILSDINDKDHAPITLELEF